MRTSRVPAGADGANVGGDGGPVEPAIIREADAALDRLVAAVEADRYSPHPAGVSAEDLAAWVAAVERPLASVGAAVDEE